MHAALFGFVSVGVTFSNISVTALNLRVNQHGFAPTDEGTWLSTLGYLEARSCLFGFHTQTVHYLSYVNSY